ncbi:hypothetical protein TIFTF001_010213 [Ficus carica]|uniref:Uncharacterized protein n=1 Tax=Ficus carica TaxID=3494 RepID=A0AA87ZV46_FICCA|nr:hypothetical protein TIFTF001_010213 [Ficus carica]
MEATTLLTLFSLLFLSFTPKLGECAYSHGISSPPAVLDSFGNQVRKGEYYILVAWPNKPLPLLYTSSIFPLVNRNGTCWVQHEIEVFTIAKPSLPVKFSPIEPNEDEFILESTLIDIKFNEAAVSYVCGGSSVWRVGDHPDQVFGQQFVNVGGHGEARTTWFKIVKDSKLPHNNYNLLFCPGDSSGCRDVGIFVDGDGRERLALADCPVPFGFSPYRNPGVNTLK